MWVVIAVFSLLLFAYGLYVLWTVEQSDKESARVIREWNEAGRPEQEYVDGKWRNKS